MPGLAHRGSPAWNWVSPGSLSTFTSTTLHEWTARAWPTHGCVMEAIGGNTAAESQRFLSSHHRAAVGWWQTTNVTWMRLEC